MREISRIVAGRRIDIVHTQTLAVISGAVWAKFNRIPHVWHVREIIQKPRIAATVFGILLRMLADVVLCNSSATRRHLQSVTPKLAEKSRVILNGLDAAARPKHGSGRTPLLATSLKILDTPIIGLVGRINHFKGHELALLAAAILKSRSIPFHLLFVGDALPQHHLIEEKCRRLVDSLALEGKVTFAGFRADVAKLLPEIDIAIVPSTEPEPFGLVAIEAMAAGKPVVAAGHGGLVEIVVDGETGFLFKPNSAEELADRLEILLLTPVLRKSFGEAGRVRFESHFSMQRNLQLVAETYDSLLHKGRDFSSS